MRSGGAHIKKELRCVGADVVDQLVKQIIGAAALGKFDHFLTGNERHHLMNNNFHLRRIESQRFHSGQNIGNRCDVIGAENIDDLVVPARKFIFMIADIWQAVRRLAR